MLTTPSPSPARQLATADTAPSSPSSSRGARGFSHLPALDGLRGVAVALVVAYHLAPQLVPGGFLGVDVFFVLSGFLITSLLVSEVSAGTGAFDVRRFYVRRVRRLTPALLLLLGALALYAWRWATAGELTRLREHSLWTLGYLANWRFISDGTTYTDLVVGASPLRHAWSLAIEEQFYIVFPLLILAVGAVVRWEPDRLRRALFGLAALGTLLSAAWMAMIWVDGTASRGYFGTDTRAHSLLVGVALGAVLVGRPPRLGRGARTAAEAGVVGAVVLVAAIALGHEDSAWLQHGGFLAVALAVAGLISALECCAWLRRPLSLRPLVGLGVISYGVYLWHWPVIIVFDAERTGVDGPALVLVRLSLTLVLALLSFVLVERPVRSGALGRVVRSGTLVLVPGLVGLLVVAIMGATTIPAARPLAMVPTPVTVDPDEPAPAVAPLHVLMVGDSVAHTLAGGVVVLEQPPEPPRWSPFDPSRVILQDATKPGCSYLPGKVRIPASTTGAEVYEADLSKFCGDWRGDLALALAEHPSDLMLVALSNDASDRSLDDLVELGSDASRALLVDFLDELREMASPHGTELALVALPPRSGRFTMAIDADGRREKVMREMLRTYAADHPDVRVLDLLEQVCPGGDCDQPVAGFDPAWRYDGMHFSPEGAQWVAAWVTAQLSSPGT
ncbi:MAG: acyltransferase family protein [Acidimicrobiales bacterium]